MVSHSTSTLVCPPIIHSGIGRSSITCSSPGSILLLVVQARRFHADIPAACAEYEDAIRQAGGVDLQILGIGTDGHIGFNEPGSSLASRTRIKTLTRQTRIDNACFFDGDLDSVPTHCLTQAWRPSWPPGT